MGVGVDGAKVGTWGKPCAFATGTKATAEVNMLRTNSARIILTKSFFKHIRDISNLDPLSHYLWLDCRFNILPKTSRSGSENVEAGTVDNVLQ